MSPLPTFAMRPLVSSSVLYVDLLFNTSTTTTTPSSAGMSGEMRTSCPSAHACVTDAILSTTTVRMALVPFLRLLACAAMKHAREGDDLRKAQRVRRGPFARGLAVHALRRRHQRVRRIDAFDEQITGPEQHAYIARHALLRRQQQRLDVPAHG